VIATSAEADHHPENPVTDRDQTKRGEYDDPVRLKDVVRNGGYSGSRCIP